jgi:bifunctional DNA-binding transcriptional regulator/antitoxin component of YhaV-PrlF toxin-antitoxin module
VTEAAGDSPEEDHMTPSLRLALPLLLAGGLIAGCGRNPGDPMAPAGSGDGAVDESAEVSQALATTPELIEDGQYESAEMTQVDGAAPGSFAAINPLYFFRKIESVERRFEFAFADTDSTGRPTTAIVTVHKLLRGTFNIATGPRVESTVRDTSRLRIVSKRLTDHWERRLLLKRVPPPPTDVVTADRVRPRWRVAASSGVEITSRPATTRILRLAIRSATQDTVIEDPLAFYRLRRIMKLEPGEEVRLVVTTERSDDVVVLVRAGLRARFSNNGDNTYTLVWHAPLRQGLHHVGVNALSHGTLFDDQAPYDSKAWIVPCVVNPTELAEFIP